MDYTLNSLVELGRLIGSFLKSFSTLLLTPIYDLPPPLIGRLEWDIFVSVVRILDPTDSVSLFILFITVGISTFITISIVKWVLDLIN